MKKVMITGYNGFVGGYLACAILKKYPQSLVIGVDKTVETNQVVNIVAEECNFSDFANTYEIIKKYSPDVIFHLAAESSVASSWHSPSFMISNNVNSQINLLESLLKLNLCDTRVLVAGSSEEYGEVAPECLPVNENCPFRPLSAYAVSKIAQDMSAFQYFKSYGMDIIRVRCFNLCGPRQLSKYVLSSFALQAVQLESKNVSEGVIKVGNLDAARDYMDVRDAVNYYVELAEKGVKGEAYNLCSAKMFNLRDLLDIIIKHAKVKIKVEIDSTKFRPSDLKVICGDNKKMLDICEYKPLYDIEETLLAMLEYWRENFRQ